MKKLLILAAALICINATAQTAEETAITKKLERSNAAIVDAKKSTQCATWIDRAAVLLDASNVYSDKMIAGFIAEAILSQMQPPATAVEDVTVGGQAMKKHVFANLDVYVREDGSIAHWQSRKELVPGALDLAFEALQKAKTLDPKYFNSKRAIDQVNRMDNQYQTDAMNAYQLGQPAVGAKMFDGSVASKELLGKIDTTSIYYAGVAYQEAGDYKSALPRFEKALSYNYHVDGTIYYYISLCQDELGQKDEAIATLEAGFAKYPSNQSIMSGLINSYMSAGKNTDLLIEIVHKAQSLSPDDVSLYIVEGTVWNKLGNKAKAEEAMQKACDMDPKNPIVFYNYGVIKINQADAMSEAVNKLDVNDSKKYNEMMTDITQLQRDAIKQLEIAFELDKTDKNTIDLLRQLCFLRRNDGAEMLARYEFFDKLQKEGQAQ